MYTFSSIVHRTLIHEGGYVHDPADPGGETNFGISQRAYPNLNIKSLTRDQAIEIYRRDYWQRPGFHRLQSHDVAQRVFDLGVNCGTRRAAAWLQQAANLFLQGRAPLVVDGICGPLTAEAVNSLVHQRALLAALKCLAAQHYISLNQPRFLAGWLNRLES